MLNQNGDLPAIHTTLATVIHLQKSLPLLPKKRDQKQAALSRNTEGSGTGTALVVNVTD
jgi:hypothetical protein